MRQTSCEIDCEAVRHNVRTLVALVAPTPLCAVVKADGYGHGAIAVAEAALSAGASRLAVALVEEGVELREAGIAAPILLLSEPHVSGMATAYVHELTPSLYTDAGVAAAADVVPAGAQWKVHLCVDSGMRRVGAEVGDTASMVELVRERTALSLTAIWTHCPVADEPSNPFTDDQLERFDIAVDAISATLRTHVGNSAVAITRPSRAASMVRCGIAVYGIDPDVALTGMADLRPALTLRSQVSFVKQIGEGEGVGYGHRFVSSQATTIATVPIGYADGVRRDLGLRGGEVLIGGQRHQIVGVVTMDQLMVDVGEAKVRVGDEVVLIGAQGDETITAADIAAKLDTIPYEVVCAIHKRVPRTYV